MKKKFSIILGAILLLLLPAAWWVRRASLVFMATDAVQVIAQEASELYRKNPVVTQEDLERRILKLHYASVINLKLDGAGKPVDPFGKPFQIRNVRLGSVSETTVISAGPDRQFGTRDDIRYTVTETISY
jgi:hypothetical protein